MSLKAGIQSDGAGLDELAEPDTIICRCEGVTRAQISEVVQQGADTLRTVKSVTRCGMGNCQGRMCEHTVAAIIAHELAGEGVTQEDVGYYSIRPPLHPLPQSFLADAVPEEE